MGLVVLDRQHVGHPSRDFEDVGVWIDRNQDGKREVAEAEGMLTAVYGLHAELRLRELGHKVVCMADGQYTDRHRRACHYKADVYLALHANAGGGDYGLVCYDERSTKGAVFAQDVADSLHKACPQLKVVHVKPASKDNEWKHAYNCISGVYEGSPIGVCMEPFFVDQTAHQGLDLRTVGYAIADGIHAYLVRAGKGP